MQIYQYREAQRDQHAKALKRLRKQPAVLLAARVTASEAADLFLDVCSQLGDDQVLTIIKLIDESRADVSFTEELLKFTLGDLIFEFAGDNSMSVLGTDEDFSFAEYLPEGLSSEQLTNIRKHFDDSLGHAIEKARRREARQAAKASWTIKKPVKSSLKKSKPNNPSAAPSRP